MNCDYRHLLFTTSVAFLLASPSQAGMFSAKAKVNRIVPPPNPVTGVSSVEVQSFSGYGGDSVKAGVREALLSKSRGTFDSKKPTLNEGFSVQAYEVVTSGGDATVSGSVDIADVTEDYKAKVSKRDSDGNVVKDSEGKVVKVEVDCKKRDVTATVQWALTDAGGKIIVQQSFAQKKSDSQCGDDRKNLASRETLADAALQSAPWAIANGFAPRWEVHVVELSKDKSVKAAMSLAKAGNWTLAMCSFREIVATDPYNVDAIYNLGAMLEVNGWYQAAEDEYARAVAVNSDKKAAEGLSRVNTRKAQLATLTAMGQTWAESQPDFSACPALPAGRPVVVKKSCPLLSAPELGSAALATLPKGMKLYVIDESSALYKVQTSDGAEGWINPKLVK